MSSDWDKAGEDYLRPWKLREARDNRAAAAPAREVVVGQPEHDHVEPARPAAHHADEWASRLKLEMLVEDGTFNYEEDMKEIHGPHDLRLHSGLQVDEDVIRACRPPR